MKYIYYTFLIILMSVIYALSYRYNNLNDKYNNELSNSLQIDNNNKALILKIDRLEQSHVRLFYMYDSIKKLNKVKDKNVKEIVYSKTLINIRDSIRLKDSLVFVKDFKLDTLIKHKTHTLDLHLEYPNIIDYNIKSQNERMILVTLKRVYKGKRKIFPLNLFQKKINKTEVEVFDSNESIDNIETTIIYNE